MWNMWICKNGTRMKHIKYNLITILTLYWSSGRITDKDFEELIIKIIRSSES